jgi:hypothetical protein
MGLGRVKALVSESWRTVSVLFQAAKRLRFTFRQYNDNEMMTL